MQQFVFGFSCRHFWILIMAKTAWSMMEMDGGLSIVFLSNSSLKCLIQVSYLIFPCFCYCFFFAKAKVGGGGGMRVFEV